MQPGKATTIGCLLITVLISLLTGGCGSEKTAAHVGSQDCSVIGEAPGANAALCIECQDQACDAENDPTSAASFCHLLPCIDGIRVTQGCAEDADCAEFNTPCGLYTSVHKMMCGDDPGDL